MLIYIVDNNKLNVVDKDTIALNKVLLNDTIIIFNLIDTLHVSKLLTSLLLINTLIEREMNVNFHDDECRIIAFNDNQVLHVIKHRKQYKLQLARFVNIVIALIANHVFKYNDNTLKL